MPNHEMSIALICAMESELSHALAHLEQRRDLPIGPWRAHQGTIAGKPVVALASGIGLVNAAAATSALIAAERPIAVFNYGCAGGHHEAINAGDIVIGAKVVANGSRIILPDGREQYAGIRVRLDDQTVLTDAICADSELLELATRVAASWVPAPWPWSWPNQGEPTIHIGVIASADCWTQDPLEIGRLHDRYRSLCEEMEAAAVAQVCALYRVPMLAIKDISNNELQAATGHGDNGPTLDMVSSEVGARSFALIARILATMGRG